MYPFYFAPETLDEALALKADYGDRARIIAGGTDLLIEMDRGLHRTSLGKPSEHPIGLIDLTRIPGLATIRVDPADPRAEHPETIHLGPLVTHNQCIVAPEIVGKAFPLARACWDLASPQIRNRGTVAGNLITASPANDLIVPLMAQDARVTLQSHERGTRTLALEEFFTGFRSVDLQPDEILIDIALPALAQSSEGVFIKLGLRRAQAPERESRWRCASSCWMRRCRVPLPRRRARP
jgi:carbon-monoxide dehydrogenase medium subunit